MALHKVHFYSYKKYGTFSCCDFKTDYTCTKTLSYTAVLVLNKNIYRYQAIFLPSVLIDIEISGHGGFPRESFQTLSQVLVLSRKVKKYGVSALAVSEI